MQGLVTFIILSILVSCAGPTSPVGASNLIIKSIKLMESDSVESEPLYLFHRPYSLKLNKNTNTERLHLRMGLVQIPINELNNFDERTQTLSFIKFNPKKLYDYQFIQYNEQNKQEFTINFNYPDCQTDQNQIVRNWGDYEVTNKTKLDLLLASDKFQINPSLLAGLVAQESSFKPHAVSWAKAVGLTQMTPSAVQDIQKENELIQEWPIQEENLNLNYLQLKTLIAVGKINKDNDWRLNPNQSLQGGSAYLNRIENYWSMDKNAEVLKKHGITKKEKTRIYLASYNSGPYRVKKQISRYGANWLTSNKLNEGRKYVHNILSYCHDFKKEGK